jgi:F-type H+-transporting ATPase subunit epsilon
MVDNNQQTVKLEIVSAERMVFSGDVRRLEVAGKMGELGIHPGHTPLLTALRPGDVRLLMPNNKEEVYFVSGGMLEVQPDVVTILADTASRADDLDEAAALAAKERAEKAIADRDSDIEYSRALAELADAAARLRAIARLRKK